MEELLSLKWNNHRSTFLHILGVLRDKQAYTDVTLACDGKFYSVHKLVLSTCSDYFCAMFEKTACKSPVIVLKDIKSEDLEALLDYMYLGEVNVRQSDLASLIKAAENLRIKGLAVPDDEPPIKKSSVGAPSRRDGGSGSPPTKRKRRDESEDGREDVRPPPTALPTPPPPPRPKSPVIQRLSPSPHRTSQESSSTEDHTSRPHSSPAEPSAITHSSSQPPQPSGSNQFPSEETPSFVKVEVEDDEPDPDAQEYNVNADGYKEEDDSGSGMNSDLPEFLQAAASGTLSSSTSSFSHPSFAGPSSYQPGDMAGWQGDVSSMGFPTHLNFSASDSSSQQNAPGVKFGYSQRGKEKFVDDGYIYVLDRLGTDNITEFWRCERRRLCKARIHVKNGEIVKRINEHSHTADPAQVEKGKVISKIKVRASETMEQTSVVINECLGNVNEACQGVLPSHSTLQKMVRRKRKDLSAYPANPTTLEELVIPVHIQTYGSEKFLLADNEDDSCRIIVFGKESNAHLLKEVKKLFVDGTFKITPPLFCQVYVILAEMHGGIHPFIYALLPNKLCATYDKLFCMLLEIQPSLQPETIYCDFEIENFKSLQYHFPSADIRGCFFHFAQNVYKKLTSMGLSPQYNNDASFALRAKMITAIAFVPLDHITAAITDLADELPHELQELLDWLEDNYVGRMIRRGNAKRPPLFPLNMWNVYQRCINDEDRTNNHAEAAHRRLQNELGMQHPTIWKFIDNLKMVQRGRDLYYEQLIAGQTPPVKLKKFREADARIKSLVMQFENRNILEYLRGIAHNFS